MSERPKVLIVDDRRENLLAVRAVIENLDIEIFETMSGEGALRLVLDHDFAVILLDVEMPGTDGFTTAQMIRGRQKSRHTPIIFLTAVDRGEAATRQGYELGAVDYIIKPFVPEVLRWKVSVFADLYMKATQTQQLLAEQAMRRESETAAKRSRLLADVTSALALNVNYASALPRLIDLVVPDFADWALLLTRQENAELLEDLINNGSPVLLNNVDGQFFNNLGVPDRGPGTVMIVPFHGRNISVGALVMFRKAPAHYSATDRMMAQDLSDRASLAIANSELFEEAEAANRAKDQFLAVVSHELRTPLNAISGWIQILRSRDLDPEKRAKAFQIIEQNAKLQDELIGDILDLSRIVAGKLSINFADVAVDDILNRTIDALKPTADAKRVTLRSHIPENTLSLTGDPKRLQQVLWNLVANAIKFTPNDGIVDVRVEQLRSSIQIQVQDSGAGIHPDFLNRVFDPFTQCDGSLKRSYGGLGLGLAITRHLVELHGGTIKAESAGEGKGATFTVTLPIRRADLRAS
jgi:signal transduction histidine kinase